MTKLIVTTLLCLGLMATAHATEFEDVITGAIIDSTALEANPKPAAQSYDIDMGMTADILDEEKYTPSDTILQRVWVKDESISVRLRRNMSTLISIPVGRRIEGYIVGDNAGFTSQLMGPKLANQIVVSPLAHEIETNLTLVDDEARVYAFHLRSGSKQPQLPPHFSVAITFEVDSGHNAGVPVSWEGVSWPDEVEANTPKAQRLRQERLNKAEIIKRLTAKDYDFLETLQASEFVNTNYKIFGDEAIAPNAVWDDGNSTYISFRDGTPSQRLPALYRVIDGYAAIANAHYRDGFLITDALSNEGWMLIDGERIVCIKAPEYAPKRQRTLSKHNNLSEGL